MIREAFDLRLTVVGDAQQSSVATPLLDIFARAFVECALDQARRGLLTRYVEGEDDIPVLRGRLQIARYAVLQISNARLVPCAYDELTADNPYNRAVRSALDAVRRWITTDATYRLWVEAIARYAGVSMFPFSVEDVTRLPRTRDSRRYEAALRWCEWIFALESPSMSAGDHSAPAILFDMNKLFETLVYLDERKNAQQGCIVRKQGPEVALATSEKGSVLTLRPDVTIWQQGTQSKPTISRIVDAKWKLIDRSANDWDIDSDDVYQMVTYAARFGCDRLELVFPTLEMSTEFVLLTLHIRIGGARRVTLVLRTLQLR